MKIILPKIRLYSVFNPKGKSIETDCINVAEKKAILTGGTVYINTRQKAQKRLQRMYVMAIYKGKDAASFDYPNLIKIN